MMCSSLQQNQRTFKWPNANDAEAAQQSQDWTLNSLLSCPLAAFHYCRILSAIKTLLPPLLLLYERGKF